MAVYTADKTDAIQVANLRFLVWLVVTVKTPTGVLLGTSRRQLLQAVQQGALSAQAAGAPVLQSDGRVSIPWKGPLFIIGLDTTQSAIDIQMPGYDSAQ